ncbi:response regulator transcription factor [Deinococcus detaillensis]|uniref:Response regulator transcription factor n=1 Tax=Deinococcus detaillensis TaxID=2592048 RepID=A0A553UJE2_9DEIO|nr:response regulator transcription factor [Deinococcus detaillensis]TSA80319.1 response regulator transcription factor [Deinococcus detaillensis]
MKIVIADDHPLFRIGLKYALRDQGFEVLAEASDGLEALEVIRQFQPDAALLDVKMPGLTGIEVCEKLRATNPNVVSVLITTFAEPAIVQAARSAGARGYLSKETAPEELARQLREIVAHPEIDRLPKVEVPRLTPREGDVLPLLAKGYSNKEIARALGVSPDTIKDHLARLFVKLAARDRTDCVGKARALGLVG